MDNKPDTESFFDVLQDILNVEKNYIIGGDINIDLLSKNHTNVINYVNILNSNGSLILNKIDKEYVTHTNSIIDHMISDITDRDFTIIINSIYISDHKYLLMNFNKCKSTKKRQMKKQIIDYNNILEKEFLNSSSINNMNSFEQLIRFLSDIIENNTKIINFNKNDGIKPWITKTIVKQMKIRNIFYSLHKKYLENSYFKIKFQHLRKSVNNMVRTSKRKYFKKQLEDSKNSTKTLWEIFNEIIVKKTTKRTIKKIVTDGKVVENEKDISDYFNQYFVNIGNSSFHGVTNQNFTAQNIYNGNCFQFRDVTSREIENIVNNMNQNSAVGYDGISSRFLIKFVALLRDVYFVI